MTSCYGVQLTSIPRFLGWFITHYEEWLQYLLVAIGEFKKYNLKYIDSNQDIATGS